MFTAFNAVITPLKFCETVGINFKPFEDTATGRITAESCEDDSSDSDSDSNSSSSGSSNSSDSLKKDGKPRVGVRRKTVVIPGNKPPSAASSRQNKDVSFAVQTSRPTSIRPTRTIGAPRSSKIPQITSSAPPGSPRQRLNAAAASRQRTVQKKSTVKDATEVDVVVEALRARIDRVKRVLEFCKSQGAVFVSDSLQAALEAMVHVGRSRVFVVSEAGDVVGVITLKDIAKHLIRIEADEKNLLRREEELDGDFFIIGDT